MKKNFILILIIIHTKSFSQNDRVNDYNTIGWLQTINTVSLNKKWGFHLEYQLRRTEGLNNWQQSMVRTGVNFRLNNNVVLHTGYGWVKTFPYGDFPIASQGAFPEHRIYEQLSFQQPMNRFNFSHRFRIEQRWLARMKAIEEREVENWIFLHRFRYQFRTQMALWSSDQKQLYAAAADEIFVGAGKKLGANIFDQNRIFLLAGYKLNKNISLEGGYINQTLQQGRRINDKTIIQRNNGFVFSVIGNF
jgi:hypothetical protein